MADAASSNVAQSSKPKSFPTPEPATPLANQPAVVLLAMCVFGEARGASPEARRAVAQVIVNRARHPHRVFGSRPGVPLEENLRRVILQPRQFSCFLESDPNYPKLLRPLDYEPPQVWRHCLDTARQALAEAHQPDWRTLHADHYFDDSLQPPSWADPAKQTVQIGRLRFYRLYLPWPIVQAGMGRAGAGDNASATSAAARDVAVPPSLRASDPPQPSRRAAVTPLRIGEQDSAARHRREGFGSGSHMSFPVPHLPSQRTPRLGSNRWSVRNRGLSSLRLRLAGESL